MTIVVIGGSWHIGTFLVRRLARTGHEVINISRGTGKAYADAVEWQHVRQVVTDRQAEDREGIFEDRVPSGGSIDNLAIARASGGAAASCQTASVTMFAFQGVGTSLPW
jgi:nucleoside-diphosphate-sugar epimerase